MVSFDREAINPIIKSKGKKGDRSAQGWSPRNNVNENVDISKVG
jgi:hypothetical protein